MEVDPVVVPVPAPSSEQQDSAVHDEETNSTVRSLRNNAINITGVDDLNTKAIETYVVAHYDKPFQIEWIDDSTLNVVYDDPDDAFQAIVALTLESEFDSVEPIAPDQYRKLRPLASKPENELRARFARDTDRKSSNSRAKSRYYLMHGEPSRKEDLVRFGTKRSKPLLYGVKDHDIIGKSRREDRSGDLFPSKAPASVDDDLMGDLLPHKADKKRPTRRGRKGRGRSKQPDLFAGKLKGVGQDGPRKAVNDKSTKGSADQPAPSVYQNMDY